MEARGLKPSLRALEDLVIAYSLKGDSSAALSTLLSLLAPECATKPDTDTVMQASGDRINAFGSQWKHNFLL